MAYDEAKFRQYLALKAEYGEPITAPENKEEKSLEAIRDEVASLKISIHHESEQLQVTLRRGFWKLKQVVFYSLLLAVLSFDLGKLSTFWQVCLGIILSLGVLVVLKNVED